MRLFITCLCLVISVVRGYSQTIYITNAPYRLCLGSPMRLNYSSGFTYAPDNKFYVEVSPNSYEETPGTLVAATAQNGFLEVTIPRETVIMGNYQNFLSLRIITTNPATKSNWISSQADASPDVRLESQKLTLDLNDQAILNFAVSGKSPVTVTLRDSLSNETFAHELTHSDQFSTSSKFTSSLSLAADRSRSYVIHSVQNECGPGKGQGKADLSVHPLGLKLISVSPAVACSGSTITANFQTGSGSFGRTNTFRVELVSYDTYWHREGEVITTLPAQMEGHLVRFRLPADLAPNVYRVYLLTSDPVSRSRISQPYKGYFTVGSAPSATLISANHTINYGDESQVQVQFTGVGPYVAHLHDGTLVKYSYDPWADRATASVKPRQTTSYTVKDYSNGCGAAEPGQSSTVITVRNGIQADSIPSKVFCEGSRVSIAIHSNFDPTGPVSVQLYNNNYGQPVQATVAGEIRNNVLTFSAPTFPALAQARSFDLEITGQNFKSSLKGQLKVGGKPYIESWYDSKTITLANPEVINLAYYAYGTGPYELMFDDGEKILFPETHSSASLYRTVYASSSKNYQVTAIRNSCGLSVMNAAVQVMVKNQINEGIGLTSEFSNRILCNNTPLDISFKTYGNFNPANRFKIMYQDHSRRIVLKELSSAGTTQVSLAAIPKGSTGSIYVESTDPVLKSNESYIDVISVEAPPEIQWALPERTVLRGEAITARVTSAMYTREARFILWSDGKKDYKSELDYNGDFQFIPEASIPFITKGMENQCGITTVTPVSVPIVVNNASLLFSSEVTNSLSGLCRNFPVELPYGVEGTLDPKATFDIQVLTYDRKEGFDVAKNITGNPIRFNWPENLDSRKDWRYLRISSRTHQVMPVMMDLILYDKPKATLTTPDGKNYLEYGRDESKSLQVDLQGGSTYNLIWNDGVWNQFSENPYFRPVHASRGKEYALRNVFNVCGYGTVSGEVSVKVHPSLTLQNSTDIICSNSRIQLSYTSSGDYAPQNYFRLVLLDPLGKIMARLDSSSKSNHQFSSVIPSTLPAGPYQIEIQSSDNQEKVRSNLFIRNKPQMTLGSHVSVPAGTAAVIRLTNGSSGTSSSETIQYTLSDGTTGSIPEYLQHKDFTFTPTQTTTYRVTSVSNSCGIGTATGSATITVESPSDKETQITQVQTAAKFTGLCSGDTVFVTFTTKGSVAANATYRVQLSDASGDNFTSLTTGGVLPKLWALIPPNLARSEYYRLKVTSSEAGVNGRTYALPLSLRQPATASFMKESMWVSAENTEPVLIQLGGDGPWQFQIGNEINPSRTITTSTNPYSSDGYSGTPTDKPAVYKLYSVSNVCGAGKILNPSTLRVEIITSVAPPKAEVMKVYPNPTKNWIRVECAVAHQVRLLTLQGTIVLEKESQEFYHQLDLSPLAVGTYLLEVTTKDQRNTYRIIKE